MTYVKDKGLLPLSFYLGGNEMYYTLHPDISNIEPMYIKFDLVKEFWDKFNIGDTDPLALKLAVMEYYNNMMKKYGRFILCSNCDGGIMNTKAIIDHGIGYAFIFKEEKFAITFALYPQNMRLTPIKEPVCSGTWGLYPEGVRLMNLLIIEGAKNKK